PGQHVIQQDHGAAVRQEVMRFHAGVTCTCKLLSRNGASQRPACRMANISSRCKACAAGLAAARAAKAGLLGPAPWAASGECATASRARPPAADGVSTSPTPKGAHTGR